MLPQGDAKRTDGHLPGHHKHPPPPTPLFFWVALSSRAALWICTNGFDYLRGPERLLSALACLA